MGVDGAEKFGTLFSTTTKLVIHKNPNYGSSRIKIMASGANQHL